MKHYAIIDIGSNSIKTQLALSDNSRFRNLGARAEVTGLGGGGQDGNLADDAMERSIAAVRRQLEWVAELCQDAQVLVAATSAVREAKNGRDFLARLQRECQLLHEPLLLSGEQEAILTFRGASCYATAGTSFLNADVGGGSTELCFGSAGGTPEFARSFQVGAVRWREMYGLANECSLEAVKAAYEDAKAIYEEAARQIPAEGVELCCSGGTSCTMVCLAIGKLLDGDDDFPPLTRQDCERLLHRHAAMSAIRRHFEPGMRAGRESVTVSGLAIMLALMDAFHKSQLQPSANGLRMGLLMQMVAVQNPEQIV